MTVKILGRNNVELSYVVNDLSKAVAINGVYTGKVIDNQDLSIPRIISNAYNRHVVIDPVTITTPGNITVAGFSINEDTGGSDLIVEDLFCSEGACTQSTAKYIGPVDIQSLGAFVGSIDAYLTAYNDLEDRDFRITGYRFEWQPSATSWNISIGIYKINNSGIKNAIDEAEFASTDTIVRATITEIGTHKRVNLHKIPSINTNMKGTQKEGFIIELRNTAGTGDPLNIRNASIMIYAELI